MSIISSARDIVYHLLKDVDMSDTKRVNKILREGYHEEFCVRVAYGGSSWGYKAWRKACREALGKTSSRKKDTDKNQMLLFG